MKEKVRRTRIIWIVVRTNADERDMFLVFIKDSVVSRWWIWKERESSTVLKHTKNSVTICFCSGDRDSI